MEKQSFDEIVENAINHLEEGLKVEHLKNSLTGLSIQLLIQCYHALKSDNANGKNVLHDAGEKIEELRHVLKRLTFAAETSGGTAGPDEHLKRCIKDAKDLLPVEPPVRAR